MPPEVVAQSEQFRMQLDAHDASQATRMARAWGDATRSLEGEYERVVQEIGDLRARGLPVSRWHITRMERYQSLLRQIDAKQRELAPVMVDEIGSAQATLARLGLEHSQAALDFISPGIVGQFDRLPYSAVSNMVGTTAGGPVGRLLRESWGANAGAVGDALVRGTALGWHPTRTAAAMRQAADMNLTRAITIARTEQLRVYRAATQMQYKAAGMGGYRRVASKSIRTCLACLMQDGQWFSIDVPFQEHVTGRCTMIPAKDPKANPVTWETGDTWFRRQDAATQRSMMGPGKFAAWQNGRFGLADLPVLVESDVWGGAWQVQSLQALTA